MSPPTFIAQPPVRLPNTKQQTTIANLSLHPLSLVTPSTPHPTTYPIPIPSFTTNPFFPPPPSATPSNTVIVWFRSDLRLHDHQALTQAIQHSQSSSILPLFIFDPRHYGKTRFGFEKTGRYRAKFLIDSVHSLRQALKKLGSDLVVRIGHPQHIIPQLARQLSATAVFCHQDVSMDDIKLESSLQTTLQRTGVQFCPLWSNTLYHIDHLPFSIDQLPDVYSTYREQVQTKSQIQPPLPPPKTIPRLPKIDTGQIPSLSQLGLTQPRLQPSDINTYIGGEAEALKKLSTFVNETATNSVGYPSAEHLGADFSCRISPWLALGCVSPRQIYADLANAAPKAKQVPIYFDLVWRDFFRYITVKYNRAKLFNAPIPRAAITAS